MKTYYPGDALPNGWYWLRNQGCDDPWTIVWVVNGKIADYEGNLWPLWDEEPESVAVGPLTPPE